MPLMDNVLIPFQNGKPIDWPLVSLYLSGKLDPEDTPIVKPFIEVDGEAFTVRILAIGDQPATERPKVSGPPKDDRPGGVRSNMQGMVLEIKVGRGDTVKAGETLLVLEAMKMENPIASPRDGTVSEIFVDTGDTVLSGDVLMVIE